ncbi:MAG: HlyC/CorC family transporter [Anaerolineales bacterium]|nr:HlyC/CorC family transporter [Anaerolineales bacterium]
MGAIAFEIGLILLLIVAIGVFALAEIAVVSSRRARLQQRAEEGDAGAAVALQLARDPARFLSTVQIGITLVGILAGAFSGATLAEAIAGRLETAPALAPYSEFLGLVAVVLPVTYLTLVIGELLPKQLALNNPERVAARVARPMQGLSRAAAPVVKLLSLSTDLLIGLLGIRGSTEPPVTVEEINILVEQGRRGGIFEAGEQDIAESALTLGDRRVSGVMTPRTEIVWVERDAPLEVVRDTIVASPHAFFPVARGSLDNVLGLMRGRDFLAQWVPGQPLDWAALLKAPLFVPETQTILGVLQSFKQTREHAALVIDEFGGVHGLVTRSDILEALVGDLPTADQPDEQIVKRPDATWLLDGRLSLAEFTGVLDLRPLPAETLRNYDTLGGFVMSMLDEIPMLGQQLEYSDWRFEVVEMDGRRVGRVLATPVVRGGTAGGGAAAHGRG